MNLEWVRVFTKGPWSVTKSVSNWAVWVMMWELQIATDISLVCDPHTAGASDSLGWDLNQQLVQHSLSPQSGSRDVWGDQRLRGSKEHENTSYNALYRLMYFNRSYVVMKHKNHLPGSDPRQYRSTIVILFSLFPNSAVLYFHTNR